MAVEIALHDHACGQEWNIPGAGIISGKEIIRLARMAAGSAKPVLPLGRIGLSLLGIFVPAMKEVAEMLYLTTESLLLSGEKYERFIGPIPATSFER
ncbi:hypothetical protein SD70_03780 [Gordoniibacillus kamchatkensis]|uniref:Uncharacterized protein n=1 Tax=Gordoniibacillus kamchatkensis TaxID=1590651 RepID=A0ABR5ALY8_9BACL|nr:hypothetical protein SD70_03780 [Paenibacillus sp. VKM B-2647]